MQQQMPNLFGGFGFSNRLGRRSLAIEGKKPSSLSLPRLHLPRLLEKIRARKSIMIATVTQVEEVEGMLCAHRNQKGREAIIKPRNWFGLGWTNH